MSSRVRSKIEVIRDVFSNTSPIVSNPSIKLVEQELKRDYVLPSGYNGITVGLKVPPGVDLVVPNDATLVSL
jgi:hypothetical protein